MSRVAHELPSRCARVCARFLYYFTTAAPSFVGQVMKLTPEFKAEQKEAAARWEAEQAPKNEAALRFIRGMVPPDVAKGSMAILEARGLPKAVARRVWEKKALWLVRIPPGVIAKTHVADLRSKYSPQGLDIVELRAVFAAAPVEFENDADGGKAAWREALKNKLAEMSKKEADKRLSRAELQNPAVAAVPAAAVALFTPEAEVRRVAGGHDGCQAVRFYWRMCAAVQS